MADSRRIPDWAMSKRSRNYSSSCGERNNDSSLTKAAVMAATAVAAYAGYELNKSVQKHGWEGTLRLIWEGDPYDPDLRDAVDRLEEAEFDLLATHRMDDRLQGLETTLDVATSSSSPDVPVYKLWNEAWMEDPINCSDERPLTIERSLADMSDRLDKIAARVDGVILSRDKTSNNFLAQRVKERKKKLSRKIVSEMERCDALLASYQVLRERTNE